MVKMELRKEIIYNADDNLDNSFCRVLNIETVAALYIDLLKDVRRGLTRNKLHESENGISRGNVILLDCRINGKHKVKYRTHFCKLEVLSVVLNSE